MRKGFSYSEAGKLGAVASCETHRRKKRERVAAYNENPTHCAECGIAMFRKRTDYHLEKAEENRRMLLRLSAQQREEKSE